jgi:hypothetical protein
MMFRLENLWNVTNYQGRGIDEIGSNRLSVIRRSSSGFGFAADINLNSSNVINSFE